MNARRFFLMLSFLPLAGCAGAPALSPIGADHPANPKAAEAPAPPPSQTLAVAESAEMIKPDESVPPMQHQHMGHDMSGMSGRGHEMSGMKHDMGAMQHDKMDMKHQAAPAQPGQGASPSAPRFTPTTFPATTQTAAVYTCPMHPEVTSDKPGKCPKCGMALVRKERKK